jgi:hypothetical protein
MVIPQVARDFLFGASPKPRITMAGQRITKRGVELRLPHFTANSGRRQSMRTAR